MEISEFKKKESRYCCAYGCTQQPVKKKGGLCHTHYARRLKERDPVALRYNQFKSKAVQRGKQVELSLQEFRAFCRNTGYIITKYVRGKNATIDRIDNTKGYSVDNIQLLTLRQNINKYYTEDINALMDASVQSNEEVPF